MKYPLASRELVADSIEAVANGHAFDGLVLIPNCDKIVPGMLMAAARLNIPAIVVSGGPVLPGRLNGTDISVSTVLKPPVVLKQEKSTKQNSASSNMPHAQAAAAVLVCSLLTL